MKYSIFIIIVLSLLLTSFAPAPASYDLTITVTGIKHAEGTIHIGLFNNPNGFPDKDKAYGGVVLKVSGKTVTYTFKNLPKGKYCIAIIHDKNGNGKMDTNFFGIPTEGFCFSNNAMGTFGPPDFDDAAINLTADSKASMKLRHF